MKKYVMIFAALFAALAGCSKRTWDDTPLQAPQMAYLPREACPVDLGINQSLVLEWDYSMGGNVRYQVIFDREGGDFSRPVYALLSDKAGVLSTATVSSSLLKSIAKLAGGQPGHSVTVIWTVRTFKGVEFVTGVQEGSPRSLILTLPFEVEVLPETLTMSGTAVEGGSRQMDHLLPVSQVKSSVITTRSEEAFCSFVRMQAGTLTLTDDQDRRYSLSAGGNIIEQEGETAAASPVPAGVVCLNLDFKTLKWEARTVTNVWFWNRPWGMGITFQSPMNYEGEGVWKGVKDQFFITWDADPDHHDSRYYFRVDYSDGSGERWGYSKTDCETGTPMDSDPGFYRVYRFLDFQDEPWYYAWKTRNDIEGRDMKATATVTMKGEHYLHTIEFAERDGE